MDLDFIFTDISSIMQTDLHLETDNPDKETGIKIRIFKNNYKTEQNT